MNANGATNIYSTSTGGAPLVGDLDPDLLNELGFRSEELERPDSFYDESDFYNEWCFVCSRPTDHRGEHDDLVEQGLASYGVDGDSSVYAER